MSEEQLFCVHSLTRRPELNGTVVYLVDPQQQSPDDRQELIQQGRLLVTTSTGSNQFSIKPPNLAPLSHEQVITLAREYISNFKYPQAIAALETALHVEQKLSPDGVRSASVLHWIGIVHRENRQLAKSEEALLKSLSIRARLNPDSLDCSTTQCALGTVCHRRSEYLDAIEWYKKAHAIQQLLAPESAEAVALLSNLGLAYKYQGLLAEGLKHYVKALSIEMKLDSSGFGAAVTRNNIGSLLISQGLYDNALKQHEKSLEIFLRLRPGSQNVADTYRHIGHIYHHQKKLDEALRAYHKSLAIEKLLDPNSPSLAKTLSSIAYVQSSNGDFAGALDGFPKVLSMEEKWAPPGGNKDVATSLRDVGSMKMRLGDFRGAEADLQKAINMYQNVSSTESAECVHAYELLAMIRKAENDQLGAMELLHKGRHARNKHSFVETTPVPLFSQGELIDEGGEAAIYRGTFGDVPCAIRAPHFIHRSESSFAQDGDIPQLIAELEKFAELWTKLPENKNLIRLLHVERTSKTIRGVPYESVPARLFSDLCASTLEKELDDAMKSPSSRKSTYFSLEQLPSAMAQLGAGLAHLHRHGHVHRDIKADNMLVTADGVWKVGDFGLLRSGASKSIYRTIKGNMLHRAPEQWSSNHKNELFAKYSIRADAWSFGISLLEVLDCLTLPNGLEDDNGACSMLYYSLAALDEGDRLNAEHVAAVLHDYFVTKEDEVRDMFHPSAPVGEVLRGCLQVDPRRRMTMEHATRLLLQSDERNRVGESSDGCFESAVEGDDLLLFGPLGEFTSSVDDAAQ